MTKETIQQEAKQMFCDHLYWHFIYSHDKRFEIIEKAWQIAMQSQPPSPEHAIAFAEWLYKNTYKSGGGKRYLLKDIDREQEFTGYTSAELYNLFLSTLSQITKP